MSGIKHHKRILLIEDQEQFYKPIMRWLGNEGYLVTHASTYETAIEAIHQCHFHLAIVDLSLVFDDSDNEDGFLLLEEIHRLGLHEFMPCIMLTAFGTMPKTLKAFNLFQVTKFLMKEAGYRRELLETVSDAFAERINLNFSLDYDQDAAELIDQIAAGVNWTSEEKPSHELLTAQLLDLFGKLFVDAKHVEISKLTPGLTGAAVIRIRPRWAQGRGTSYVAKIAREDKVRIESERFQRNVRKFLPPNKISQVESVAYTRHLGALLFTFTENEMVPLKEFDDFYAAQPPDVIVDSLRRLFETTCRNWYNETREPLAEQDLQAIYYESAQYGVEKLIQRIQIVLPEFDPFEPTYQFQGDSEAWPNPVYWLEQHGQTAVLPVHRAITHGDLTGRNIMVDQTDKCWLIDFYRTQPSHIMRDFVILETDLKYRLMPELSQGGFFLLEQSLLDGVDHTELERDDVAKGVQVIRALRELALQFAAGERDLADPAVRQLLVQEHLVSLLMTTLNIVRMRHISEARKFQAMLSASLLCMTLDRLGGRSVETHDLLRTGPLVAPFAEQSAQLHHLSSLLKAQRLSLYLGSQQTAVSATVQDWVQKRPWRELFRLVNEPSDAPVEQQIYKFVDQMSSLLHNGESILLLGATKAELLVILEASHGLNVDGQLWVANEQLLEDEQDSYRSLGFRVLLEPPEKIINYL